MFKDFHFALRVILRNRSYAFWFVLLLALAIGINTSMFSLIRGVLLKPLPYFEASRLVRIRAVRDGGERLSAPDFRAARQIPSIATAAMYRNDVADIKLPSGPVSVAVAYADGDLFEVLGIKLLRGHSLSSDEPAEAVISYRFWQDELEGHDSWLGGSITVDRKPYRIVGIAPREIGFPNNLTMIWLPLEEQTGGGADKLAVARLKTTATKRQAQAEIEVVAARLISQGIDHGNLKTLILSPLEDPMAAEARSPLLLLAFASGLVLLLACANLAHLQISQGARRLREVAVRQALGANRGWAVWQVMCESFALCVIGGACALGVALMLNRLIQHFGARSVPFLRSIHLDWSVFCYAALLCLLSTAVSGILPARQLYRSDVNQALNRSHATPFRLTRLKPSKILAASEVACAVALLLIFGVMAKSLWRMTNINVGFDAHNVLTMWITLPDAVYRDDSQIKAFFSSAIARIRELPDVEAVGASNNGIFNGSMTATVKDVRSSGNSPMEVELRSVNDGIFSALKIKLLRGRLLDDSPRVSAGSIGIVVDEILARRLFPTYDPIGRRIQLIGWTNLQMPMEIVGVASSVRDIAVENAPVPTIYLPYWASPSASMSLLVRTRTDPYMTVPSIRRQVASIDDYQPIAAIENLDTEVSGQITPKTIRTALLGSFGLLAIIVAVSGVYSIIATETTQRTREIAISMAVGADPSRILWAFIRQGIQVIAVGVCIGSLVGVIVNKIFASLWFEVSALDMLSAISAVSVVSLSALLATYYPALKATRISPAAVLRRE